MAKGKGGGKPCGASHISANKKCRVGLPRGTQDALNETVKKLSIERVQSVPGSLKRELEALAARDQQLKSPKEGASLAAIRKQYPLLNSAAAQIVLEGKRKKAADPENSKYKLNLPSAREDLMALRRAKVKEHIGAIGDNRRRLSKDIDEIDNKLDANLKAKKDNRGTKTRLWSEIDRVQAQIQPSESLSRAARAKALGEEEGTLVRDKNTGASTNTRWNRQDAKDFDRDFTPGRTVGDENYKWSESYGKGTTKLGEGSFGQVMKTVGPPPLAVKRGELAVNEANLIDRVGNAGLGPKLVSAQLDSKAATYRQSGQTLTTGRIAMTIVPGKDLNGRVAEEKVGNTTVGDAFWRARADLHRMGIAHNDMHPGNVFVDEKGKGRFVDMGLAQGSPKAALSEAMGVFDLPRAANISPSLNDLRATDRGDWQAKRFQDMTGVRGGRVEDAPKKYQRISRNKELLVARLKEDGFSTIEINQMIGNGIRKPETVYEQGPWAKMSNEQAQSYINDLYKGV